MQESPAQEHPKIRYKKKGHPKNLRLGLVFQSLLFLFRARPLCTESPTQVTFPPLGHLLDSFRFTV
jgi:hypothetical protein